MAAQPGISLADVADAISVSDILVAVRQNFPGELARHGLSEAQKQLSNFDSNHCTHIKFNNAAEELRVRTTADMQFCAERSAWQLWQQTGGYGGDSPSHNMCRAAVCLAAANEYICAEILELAGNCAMDRQSRMITPRDIYVAIFSDQELDWQFTDCAIFGASVIPVRCQLYPQPAACVHSSRA